MAKKRKTFTDEFKKDAVQFLANHPEMNIWSYVKKTDTDFRESADTANSTKDFLRFLP